MTKINTNHISLNIQPWHKILIVGGGSIAMAKLMFFKDHKEKITVVSKNLSNEFKDFIVKKNINYIQNDYKNEFKDRSKLLEFFIIIVACNDNDLNKYIHNQIYKTNTLLNIVDNAKLSTFHLPAVVKRDDLQVSISTNGKSPALGRWIKHKLERIIDLSYDNILNFIGNNRTFIRSKLQDSKARRLFWYDFIELASNNKSSNLQNLFDDLLNNYINNSTSKAKLYLVGVGSGDPENITLKAINAISQADVILYDRLIPKGIINSYSRSEAIKIYVGKERNNKDIQQNKINDLIRTHLSNNKIVTRVKGGDTSIFSRVGEEINIAKNANISYELIPGISAMSGCSAKAGFPLTLKGVSSSVKVMTIYKDDDLNDIKKWQSINPTETLVFYMSIRYLNQITSKLIDHNFNQNTPIAIIENGTMPNHTEYYATLGTLQEKYKNHSFKNPSLIIVGNVLKIAINL